MDPRKILNFKVQGGNALSGTIETNTSKNGTVALLCASLLNRGTTVLNRVPDIEETKRIIEVLRSIGVSVEQTGSSIKISRGRLALESIDEEAARRTRSVILMIGALIHEYDLFSLPQAGGCKLGSRTVRPHFYALESFGVNIETKESEYQITRSSLSPATVIMYESGETATTNALLAAARIPGRTVIKYAASNYPIREVCCFLQKLGVKIEGSGTSTLTVHGIQEIDTDVEYTLSEDPTDAMFFIAAAIVTNSELEITRCPIDFLEKELLILEKMGLRFDVTDRYTSGSCCYELVDLRIYPSTLQAPEEKIHALPYPGLNMDNLPFFAAIATQATGQTMIHDWVYEKRAIYFTELDKLGADTLLADPHRIFITGPTELKPAELVCPPALRPATIILIGMLAASGTSILRNVYSINRGYANLANRLRKIGADIELFES